jgi:hypothetical protein
MKMSDENYHQPKRLVRRREAIKRLGVGRTFFDTEIVKSGKLRMFPIGLRATACLEQDLENLIDSFARGAAKPKKTKRYQRPANDAA